MGCKVYSCDYCGQVYGKIYPKCVICGAENAISIDDDCDYGSGCECKPKYKCDYCSLPWPDEKQTRCPSCLKSKRVKVSCVCEKDKEGLCSKDGGCDGDCSH